MPLACPLCLMRPTRCRSPLSRDCAAATISLTRRHHCRQLAVRRTIDAATAATYLRDLRRILMRSTRLPKHALAALWDQLMRPTRCRCRCRSDASSPDRGIVLMRMTGRRYLRYGATLHVLNAFHGFLTRRRWLPTSGASPYVSCASRKRHQCVAMAACLVFGRVSRDFRWPGSIPQRF
ncbi:hypothetical protein B0H15DRAFT_955846 [Mycena belliarum]|uniref:Uncharacterized protein n=1 Tax=Mycena belliarum TaxID=1033014 RepID=A0AAD6XMW6_9AGAR|nr:hypothetical protein B0H15DRAFT_955846 [Mycena belliae]